MHFPSWRTWKARMPALLAALSTLLGVLTAVDVLPLLPETIAGKPTGPILLALGAIVGAFTRPVYGPAAARAGARYRQRPPAPPDDPERDDDVETVRELRLASDGDDDPPPFDRAG